MNTKMNTKRLFVGLAAAAVAAAMQARGDFTYGGYDTSTGYYQESGTASVSGKSYSTTSEDTNVIQVRGGTFSMSGCTVTKEGGTSHTDQSDDSTSFYGLNSAVFAGNSDTSTTAVIAMTNGTVTTSGQGANAFFAYGGGILYLDNIAVTNSTSRQSRGLIATGGGQIYASNMYILTQGETSSVIATDRGGGTVVVDGGDYDAKGNKCAIIYSAGTMKAYNATGESSSGEIGIIEGDNSIVISNCTFTSGSTSRALLMMQSGSGDASGTNPVMEITDSTLTVTESGVPLLEVATCVTASLTLDNVEVDVPSGVLMAVMEDSQWSTSGAVGNLTLKNGDYTGTVTVDDGYTGNVTVDSTATWTLTADTTVDTLVNNGTIVTGSYTLSYTTLSGSGTITTESSGGGSTDSGSTDDSGSSSSDSGDSGDSGSGSTDSGDDATSETALADETGILDARPELLAFPNKTSVTAAGTYEASAIGTDFVLSGTIDGNVAITATETCRITLSDLTMSGVLAITGDAQLWLKGESTITTTESSAITSTDTLTIGGPGSFAATAAGAKKVGVIETTDFILAGGETTLTISSNTKNACGVSMTGNYTQLAGKLKVVSTQSKKSNGVYLSTKKTTAKIYGGTLDVALAGEKSVGLALDKSTITGTMSGGVLKFAMSGDGAKGIKGDGTFTMTGGAIDAEMTGGYVEELLEYEDSNDVVWNYYITLGSSSKTTGNSDAGSSSLTVATSTLIANGTYAVYDPSKAYGVKVGTLNISDGLVRVRCTGTCGRGLGADTMNLSGGVYDISVAGGPTDVYVESLVDADELDDDTATNGTVTVCLDSGGAACLKADDLTITGGKFELLATGNAGKLINVGGCLVIGAEGSTTLPTDSAFAPDIQGSALGEKVYCTYYKQKYYGSFGTAVATTNIADVSCSVASDNLVAESSDTHTQDDVNDYSNPKGIKAESGITVNGGRIRVYTANAGGEGLESKDVMTINGGIIELVCCDDAINTGGNLTINDGYIYAASSDNDAIDSNASITMNGGWVQAWTLSASNEGFDSDNGLILNGGYLVAAGSAASTVSSYTQNYYQGSYTFATTAKYLYEAGTKTVYFKVPAAASSSSGYILVSVPGMTSGKAPTSYGTSAPSGATSVGFHGFYTK